MVISDTQYNFLVSQLNQINRRLTSIETIMKPIVEDSTILQKQNDAIVNIEKEISNLKTTVASLVDEQEA